ncbi:MAG: signal recognition particle-docking protein FtsY [Bacillota bacterium]|nr:signal recognition particle-docking protein FtsY [Thermoanaerobacteraceae bacterium]
MGLFGRLRESLSKARQNLVAKIENVISRRREIDEELYEELEDILILADTGVAATTEIMARVRARVKELRLDDAAQLKQLFKEEVLRILGTETAPLALPAEPPAVILVVGVNGTGKTTTIGKLAWYFREQGKKSLLAAADTFRAAAIDQLEVWAGRAGADIIKQREGSDPAAVVYDALQAAKARRADVVLVDTAGRLHTKTNLMEELKKLRRVAERVVPGAPHEVLLVVDATTGQNAVSQAKLFGEATGVTGIILTKLDGTAKGGVVVAIKKELGIPVKFVGTGEKIDDIMPFNPEEFVAAIFD